MREHEASNLPNATVALPYSNHDLIRARSVFVSSCSPMLPPALAGE